MSYQKIVCVIIDAYSTGKYFAPALRGKGYDCIHIKSDAHLPTTFQHIETDFIESLTYDEKDIILLIEKLRSYKIRLIIAGCESGLELVDLLNHKLHLPGNDPTLSRIRRDKYLMTQKVAESELKTVKQYQTDSLPELLEWVKSLDRNDWPVVLKPIASQSGDHVFFCKNESDLKNKMVKILNEPNLFGEKNHTVLAESFNDGQEYIVNTVSYEGKHFLVDIWRIEKMPGTIIYDYAEMIDAGSNEFHILYHYVTNVLDAVGIVYGPGTTELKYTPEKGPMLIETTARPMAGMPVAFCEEISGFTQISMTIEAYLNPKDFFARLNSPRPKINKYGMIVVLISDVEGELRTGIDMSPFHSLKTVFDYTFSKNKKWLDKTVDSVTAPGEIYLMSDCKEALFEDYKMIRAIESTGFYRNALK